MLYFTDGDRMFKESKGSVFLLNSDDEWEKQKASFEMMARMVPGLSVVDKSELPSTVVKADEELEGFSAVMKANPYHDERGRFSSHDGAKFVSIGGVFDRQRSKVSVGAKPRNPHYETDSNGNLTLDAIKSQMDAISEPIALKFTAEEWRKLSPKVGPMELAHAVLSKKSVESGSLVGANLKVDGSEILITAGHGSEVYGLKVKFLARRFITHEKEVYHSHLETMKNGIPTDSAGGVKALFRESIPMYQKMGMEKVTVFANIDAGAYAWGRYGFHTENSVGYSTEVESKVRKVRQLLENLDALTPEVKTEISALGRILREEDLNPALPVLLSGAHTPALTKALIDHKIMKPKKRTAMQHILDYEDFHGYLDLKDGAQLSHLSKYTGGSFSPK